MKKLFQFIIGDFPEKMLREAKKLDEG